MPVEKNINKNKPPGLTILKNKSSQAFLLISFMVSELFLIFEMVEPPVDLTLYGKMDSKDFNEMKLMILDQEEKNELISLDMTQSIFMYKLIDLTCKVMVYETNEHLEKMAKENLEIEKDDYWRIRSNYLGFAEKLLTSMNKNYKDNDKFQTEIAHLSTV